MVFTSESSEDKFISHVTESHELSNLVQSITNTVGDVEDSIYFRIQNIFEKYLEHPQLLDPILENVISPLMLLLQKLSKEVSSDGSFPFRILNRICSILHTVIKVRGQSTIARFFPHSPSDLEPALALLESYQAKVEQDKHSKMDIPGGWETFCVLLLWLSVLVLIPFDLATVDSKLSFHSSNSMQPPLSPSHSLPFSYEFQGLNAPPIVHKLMSLCYGYLSQSIAARDVAARLLSRLLTRPDMSSSLHSFCVVACNAVNKSLQRDDKSSMDFFVLGMVSTMSGIFKVGGRDILLPEISDTWHNLVLPLVNDASTNESILLRRYLTKTIQRIGLSLLPPRLATWRYQRGSRILNVKNENMECVDLEGGASMSDAPAIPEGEEHFLSEENTAMVEQIIDFLLNSLRDKETALRWSAAKGIGRVTSRLSLSMAEDILTAVLSLFDDSESHNAWHGGCLCLAELAQRGLILPKNLSSVFPLVVKALHYDVSKGSYSVGSNVRDSAAYVCWSFARAYSPSLLSSPFTEHLSPALLSVACYDREVNCRRAASASFQECVGRIGNFPHGIEIITAADFMAVGSLSHSYKTVSVFVFQFHEYRKPLVQELVMRKMGHWNRSIRELCAESMALLAPLDPNLFLDHVIPILLSSFSSFLSDLPSRHGCLLTLSQVILALYNHGFYLPEQQVNKICCVFKRINTVETFKGKGGELLRSAFCLFVHNASLSRLPLMDADYSLLLHSLEEHLVQPIADIQSLAAQSICTVLHVYESKMTEKEKIKMNDHFLSLFSNSSNSETRRGITFVFSRYPFSFLSLSWEKIIHGLCKGARCKDKRIKGDFVETRIHSVKAIACVCKTMGTHLSSQSKLSFKDDSSLLSSPLLLSPFIMEDIVIKTLLDALEDYTVSKLGDVGSLVREAAMDSLQICLPLAYTSLSPSSLSSFIPIDLPSHHEASAERSPLKEERYRKLLGTVFALISKQAVEKIDRVRSTAFSTFHQLLHLKKEKEKEKEKEKDEDQEKKSSSENNALPFFESIPHLPELLRLFPENLSANWMSSKDHFARFVCLLQFPEYQKCIISGIIISIGGLVSPSLSHIALTSFLNYLSNEDDMFSPSLIPSSIDPLESVEKESRRGLNSEEMKEEDGGEEEGKKYDEEKLKEFCFCLLQIMEESFRMNRIILPSFKTCNMLFTVKVLSPKFIENNAFGKSLFDIIIKEVWYDDDASSMCNDVSKLNVSIDLLCHLASSYPSVSKHAISKLISLLKCDILKVRKYCAEQLYLVFLTMDDEIMDFDSVEQCMEILSSANWENSLESTKQHYFTLCSLINI